MKKQQLGGTILGFILGLVVGLGVALGVAVYVSKVPIPFLNKAGLRGVEQDAVETQKNKNWDPNSPLYGKNPARPNVPAAAIGVVGAEAAAPDAVPPASAVLAPLVPAAVKEAKVAPPASSKDPLGDLVKAKGSAAAEGKDPFLYFVQAGAFRTQSDADAQRAKLAMLGSEARVTEREQNGRTVFRVRVGPFDKRVDADQIREKLDGAKVESNLVRVQR